MRFDVVIPVLYSPPEFAFYDALASWLEEHGHSVALLPLTRDGERFLSARHRHVFYLYRDIDRRRPASLDEIKQVVARYRLGSMDDHVFPERIYWGRPVAELATRAVRIFGFLEEFCAQHSVGMFLNNVGGEIVRRCMTRLAEAGGPPNAILDFAPLHGRLALTTREAGWDELPAVLPHLDAPKRAAVEELVTRATRERKMFCAPSPLGIKPRNLWRGLRMAKALLSDEPRDYSLAAIYAERLRWVARRPITRAFYEQPVAGEPYLFFPLHLGVDSALTIRAPQYVRQEVVVDHLVNHALPPGVKLYVKPHVGARDAYPIGMLAELRRMPNVRLIDPTANSHAMIQGALGTIVINSTVGFESLLYGKPVVTLGRSFYRGYGITTDVESLYDAREAVRTALEGRPDRELTLRFLGACLDATFEGSWFDVAPENIARLGAAIVRKAERLRQPATASPAARAR